MSDASGSTEPAVPPAWPGEPESLVVTVDTGDRLHYLDWGGPSGLPPLLLIHALAQTGWSWAPVARRLRSVTRVLAMDLRGHGLSDSPRTGYELESAAYDALTVLVANGWAEDANGPPAVVAGHGLGALVAVTMAAIQPRSICGLGLIDAGWEDIAEATGQTPAEFEQTLGEPPEVMRSMEVFLADRRDYDPATWDPDQERAARSTVEQKHAGHVALVARSHVLRACVAAMFEYRPADLLAATDQPMLVALAESGAADDELARERSLALDEILALRTRAGVSPARVERYVSVGHNLMRYRPVDLSAALAVLLEEAANYQRS